MKRQIITALAIMASSPAFSLDSSIRVEQYDDRPALGLSLGYKGFGASITMSEHLDANRKTEAEEYLFGLSYEMAIHKENSDVGYTLRPRLGRVTFIEKKEDLEQDLEPYWGLGLEQEINYIINDAFKSHIGVGFQANVLDDNNSSRKKPSKWFVYPYFGFSFST